jgi:hypothetical protein
MSRQVADQFRWARFCVVCNAFVCVQEKSFAAAVDEQRRIMKQHGSELTMDILGEMEVLHLNIQGEAARLPLAPMGYVLHPSSWRHVCLLWESLPCSLPACHRITSP